MVTIVRTVHRIVPELVDEAKSLAVTNKRAARERAMKFNPRRRLAYQAACERGIEINAKHGISPEKWLLEHPIKFIRRNGPRQKITLPKLSFMGES
jgi:hypothetical protein